MQAELPIHENAVSQKPKTLWQIGEDLAALNDLLEEVDGDITDPAVEAAVDSFFKEVSKNEGVKLDNYIGFIKRMEMYIAKNEGVADMLKAELATVNANISTTENRIKWSKTNLINYLQATQRKKVETESGRTIAIQGNGGNFPIEWADKIPSGEEIPEAYRKTTITIDHDKVYNALKNGGEVPFAKLLPRGVHIRIK